MLNLW